MTWADVKNDFIRNLSAFYPKEEIDSFFYVLLDDIWGINKLDFFLNKDKEVSLEQLNFLNSAIQDLQNFKPIQHITGKAYCFDRAFMVNPNVLIPRPETEELISIVLKEQPDINLRILDIGTGSGIIPITLNLERPDYQLSAIDVSKKALEVAKYNAENLKAKVQFYEINILDKNQWNTFPDKSFDVIISNPPYVLESEKEQMHANVLNHDPALALFVQDTHPLIFYESIAEFASQKLKPQGKLYFEINEKFGEETAQLLHPTFSQISIIKDFRERERFVKAVMHL